MILPKMMTEVLIADLQKDLAEMMTYLACHSESLFIYRTQINTATYPDCDIRIQDEKISHKTFWHVFNAFVEKVNRFYNQTDNLKTENEELKRIFDNINKIINKTKENN